MSSRLCLYLRRRLASIFRSFGSRLGRRGWRRGSRITSEPPRSRNWVNLEAALLIFGYSPRHFTYLDPRIETHLKKHFIPAKENVLAYLRADMITKDTSKFNPKFPGILIFTSEKLYIMKITNEELGDLDSWLEKCEEISLENVKYLKAVCYNQAISVTYDKSDRSLVGCEASYLVLLHEQKRTCNFLSFLKNSRILPPEKINNQPNNDVPFLPQFDEDLEYFFISEIIVIYRNLEEWKRYSLPGFAFSQDTLLILEYSEINERSISYETAIIIEYQRKIVNLVRAEDKKNLLVLQFNDAENSITEVWYIKTGLAVTHRIIAQLNDIWNSYH